MPTLGLPTPMFVIFVATVVAGSLGALHYLVAHVIMGRPFAETPPPVLRGGDPAGRAGEGRSFDGRSGTARSSEESGVDPSEGTGAPGGGGDAAGGGRGGDSPRG